MLKAKRLFKAFILSACLALVQAFSAHAGSSEALQFKKQESGLYKDVFDQNLYSEGVNYLHLERFYRDLFGKRVRARNVNVFGEVADNRFFKNCHGRKRLSSDELQRGHQETAGPDTSGNFVITKGKFEGLHPGFFIKDARGDGYLFKFDPVDNFELTTSAEVIASRFYHAIGYNVPQYTIVEFSPEKLVPGPDANIVDESGFKVKLTKERLEEFLLFVPQNSAGNFRVSASKLVEGKHKGVFSFNGRKKDDPEDVLEHRFRREVRALQVFSSWLGNYDVRESNTLNMEVEESGSLVLKPYLFDFNAAFGAGTKGAKPPMFLHEHMMDFGETLKAYFSLGFWEKPWQKRWREAGKEIQSPAVGYFDNNYFEPDKFKTQLPYYAFKDVTRADGFWAAKIIMKFTDEDIAVMIKPGELSRSEDAAYLSKILSERRDIVARYWFSQVNPLDEFDIRDGKIVFEDLAVQYGFETREGTTYYADVIGNRRGKKKKITTTTLQSHEPVFPVTQNWFSEHETVDLLIRTSRSGSNDLSPYVLVSVDSQGIARIVHED